MPLPLAPHHDLAGSPIQVVEFQPHHLTGAEAEPGEQHEDRVVSPADAGPLIARAQQTFDLLCTEILGDGRQPPVGHRRHASRQVRRNLSLLQQEAEEGPQRRHHQLRSLRAHRVGMALDEARDVRGIQDLETQGLVSEAFDEQAMNEWPIGVHRCLLQPALSLRVGFVAARQAIQRGLRAATLAWGNDSFAP